MSIQSPINTTEKTSQGTATAAPHVQAKYYYKNAPIPTEEIGQLGDYKLAAGADHHETKRNIKPLDASPLLPILGGLLGGFAFLFFAALIWLIVEVLK